MAKDDNIRSFSYALPTYYDGATYPSTVASVEDNSGIVQNRKVFADANGEYFAIDNNGRAIPVSIGTAELPEVVVTAPRNVKAPTENMLSDSFNKYLTNYYTLSNDNTMTLNAPHREYNIHLKDRALNGAKSNALWEKEHPTLTKWGYALGAAPFAVASIPFVGGAAEYAAGTALGQGITNGLGYIANAASNSTWLPWLDAAATSYFGANGLQDVRNGNITPETAMDLMPLGRVGKSVYNTGRRYFDLGKSLFRGKMGLSSTKTMPIVDDANKISKTESKVTPEFISKLDWSPESWFGRYRPGGQYDAEDVATLEAHLPEYYQIEQQARADGTWMRDASGRMLAMDPREWVIRQSKDYKAANLTGKRHYTGVAGEKALNYSYNGDAWTDLEKNISQSFKDSHSATDNKPGVLLQLDYPKSSKKVVFDSQNHIWYDLPKDNFIEGHPMDTYDATANEAVRQARNQGYDVSQFNNIIEGNHNNVTDVVIHSGTPRKSVLGNNGNFDMSNLNIYKALAPFAIPIILPNKR